MHHAFNALETCGCDFAVDAAVLNYFFIAGDLL